jgi:hypothetical protein
VYVLKHDDRHADTDVAVYASRAIAIAEAYDRLSSCDDGVVQDMNEAMHRDGWVFYGSYGESDSIIVMRREVK